MTPPFFLSHTATPLAHRYQAFAWETTPLGCPNDWSATLKALVPVILASNQPMFLVWGAARTLLYNDAYAEVLASKHPQALGRDFLDVWHEIRDEILPIVTAAYRGEPVQMNDIELWTERRGYREETHFSFFYSPVRSESGDVCGFLCACNEVTSQILAERRLAESEARHRGILENMEEGFTLLNRDFTILEVNQAALQFVGLPREELIGHNHWEWFPGTFDAPIGVMYRQALAEQQPHTLEHEHHFPDGRHCWFEVRAFPVGNNLAVVFQDVTKRKKLQEELSTSFERTQLALDAGAIVGTWIWNISTDCLVADERFATSFGLEPERLRIGAPIEYAFGAIHPADQPRVREAVAHAIKERGQYRCQYRVLRGGSYRWVEASGRVEVNEQGVPARFPGVLLDIEERHQIEQQRDRVLALLETFIESVPGAVFAKDHSGKYLIANRGVIDVFGRPAQEIIGRTDAEVLPDARQAAAIMARDQAVMESGVAQQAEERLSRADGKPSIWWTTKEPLRDKNGQVFGLVGTSVDITERKTTEDALRLSEQRSALAVEVAQLGTWHWNVITGAITADLRCRQMCGLDLSQPTFALDEIRQRVHADDWAKVEQALTEAMRPDGPGRYAEEFRWVHPDGRMVWTLSHGIVQFELKDGVRQPVELICSLTDTTERRQMLEALQQADRRKDEFLAMLAHELRNPLAPISTASHVLKLSATDAQRVREASDIIGRQVGHMTRLVDDLLDVSRVTRGLIKLERKTIDLRSVISTAVEQAKPLLQSRRHELTTRVGAGPFTIKGDFHRLVQVVSNLLNNAAKYTPQQGQIEINLGVEENQAAVSVTDNGVGITASMIHHVFDLFAQAERTPDRSQGGLGIGLALVRSLVQLHDGKVSAKSAGLHQGSTFRFELPLYVEADIKAKAFELTPAQAAVDNSAFKGHVLIVDDNTDAAETLAELLRLMGYTVASAYDAKSALTIAAKEAPWEAFILDIGLPDMTGYELAQRLRDLPNMTHAKYVALTGYSQAHDRVISKKAGFDHHLVKPADIHRLTTILSNELQDN